MYLHNTFANPVGKPIALGLLSANLFWTNPCSSTFDASFAGRGSKCRLRSMKTAIQELWKQQYKNYENSNARMMKTAMQEWWKQQYKNYENNNARMMKTAMQEWWQQQYKNDENSNTKMMETTMQEWWKQQYKNYENSNARIADIFCNIYSDLITRCLTDCRPHTNPTDMHTYINVTLNYIIMNSIDVFLVCI